ncbi:MAG: hypothetical protein ACOC2B_06725, partial [Sediminispirochaetaceae bacterium]
PESGLPISQLGVIKRFRYSESGSRVYVFTGFHEHRSGCLTCVGISMAIEKTLERELKEELEKEFPGFSVEFVPE